MIVTNILQAFREAWCPLTNTLLTYVGEISILLWDLYEICGLPITICLYEEVILDITEFTRDDKGKRFIPQTCEYLFEAFCCLLERNSDNPNFSMIK